MGGFGVDLQREGRTTVVSICSQSHLDVWVRTSALLRDNISADEYLVYVPEEETKLFRSCSPAHVTVASQLELGQPFFRSLARAVEEAGNQERYGWYLQQFLKIQALLCSDSQRLVIWDADCVPVRPQEVFGPDGRPNYGLASEFHEPYFDNIQRLMGMNRVQEHSFVIPGFPVLSAWVHEWSDFVKTRLGTRSWFDAVQMTTQFNLKAGFSETETLGTWVANRYPGEWTTEDLRWERLGQSRFGYARNFTSSELVNLGKRTNLDVISFENWDTRGARGALKQLRRRVSGAFRHRVN